MSNLFITPPTLEEVRALSDELRMLLQALPDAERASDIAASVNAQISAVFVPPSHPFWRLRVSKRLREEIDKLKAEAP